MTPDPKNQKRSISVMLMLVLSAAFLGRFTGIWANLPLIVHPDEPHIVNRALQLTPSDMNPHFFDWPGSLLIYGLFLCYRMLLGFGNLLQSLGVSPPGFLWDMSTYYFIGRLVVVLFGVATVYLVYQIGEKIHGALVGLIAALFLAFSVLHVEASHHALPDIPLAFFIMLSFLYCLRIYELGHRGDYIRAGIYAGLAVALKYNGGILVLPIGLAHLLHKLGQKRPKEILCSANLYLAFLTMGAGFILGCPYAILDFSGFWEGFSGQVAHQTSGHIGFEPDGNGWFYLLTETLRHGMGSILLILSIAGFIYAVARISFINVLLISTPLVYFCITGASKVQFSRYAVPLLPFLAILAAKLFIDGVSYIASRHLPKVNHRQILTLGCALFCVLSATWRIAAYDWRISQKDTRLKAREWFLTHIAPGSIIAVEGYGPPLFKFQKQMNRDGQHRAPVSNDRFDGIESQSKVFHPYSVHSIPLFDGLKNEWGKIQERKTEYVILSSFSYARYFSKITEQNHPEVTRSRRNFYQIVRQQGTLLKAFRANALNAPGPDIEIYQIQ